MVFSDKQVSITGRTIAPKQKNNHPQSSVKSGITGWSARHFINAVPDLILKTSVYNSFDIIFATFSLCIIYKLH